MIKRAALIFMSLILLLAVGCSEKPDTVSSEPQEIVSSTPAVEETKYAVNSLTGVAELEIGTESQRPIAVMIENSNIVQPYQCGLSEADIVYETEVEGGITRLVAIFKDISKAEKVGPVRSARYVFLDLALSHDAVYYHAGQDNYHIGSHFNDIDSVNLLNTNLGKRIPNGLSTEHTFYAYTSNLVNHAQKTFRTENKKTANWQNFADENESVILSNTANAVSVSYNSNYNTTFKYNAESGKYVRYNRDTVRKDYNTGETLEFKNVFILNTTIRIYPDCTDGNNHREVMLNSGDGYYCVNGTYVPIKWRKGDAASSFTFTNTDGSPLEVNAGNSWVCIANTSVTPQFS